MQIISRNVVKPTIYKATTKDGVISSIRNAWRDATYTSSTSFGYGLHSKRIDKVRVYNLEKHRAKKVLAKGKHTGRLGLVQNTKILEKGHWIAYTYDLDVKMLQSLGLKVEQKTRNFLFVDKKGNKYTVAEIQQILV